jgi:hypothetical protein
MQKLFMAIGLVLAGAAVCPAQVTIFSPAAVPPQSSANATPAEIGGEVPF